MNKCGLEFFVARSASLRGAFGRAERTIRFRYPALTARFARLGRAGLTCGRAYGARYADCASV